MLAFDLILRWMHIVGAIMLVGGTIFLRCAYVPAKASMGDNLGDDFVESLRNRWSKLVMISSGQLLISGLVGFVLLVKNFEISKEAFPGSAYHMIFGIKFLIALVVFFLSAALSGKSGLAQKLRQREKTWLTINMILAITVVCMAGIMRLADRSEKSTSSVRQPAPSVVQTSDVTSSFSDP